MKISKVVKGAVLASFAVLMVAGGAFAGTLSDCLKGDANSKYPNLSTNAKSKEYPVKCARVKDTDNKYVTIYAKSSADCSQVGSLTSDPDGCNGSDMNEMIQTIITAIIFVVGIISVVMIILGGINYATSQGDAGKVKKGKDTILYGIIGLVISILAFAIVNFVLQSLSA